MRGSFVEDAIRTQEFHMQQQDGTRRMLEKIMKLQFYVCLEPGGPLCLNLARRNDDVAAGLWLGYSIKALCTRKGFNFRNKLYNTP
jgi:hypothetical protein